MRLVSGGCGRTHFHSNRKPATGVVLILHADQMKGDKYSLLPFFLLVSFLFLCIYQLSRPKGYRWPFPCGPAEIWPSIADGTGVNVRAQTAKWLLWPTSNKARLQHACWGQRPLGSEECVGLVGSQIGRPSAGQQRRINWEARLLKVKLTLFVIWLTTSGNFPLMSSCSTSFLNYADFANYGGIQGKWWKQQRRFVSPSENGLAKTSQIYKRWNFPAEEAAYWTGNGAPIAFSINVWA